MNCAEESIKIRAKGRSLEAIVSLRQNELIQNLRALVAVRFEQAISQIVLVFAGEVLSDEGTIASRGIISGVTVHVVCRPGQSGPATPAVELKPQLDPLRTRGAASLARILGHPKVLRSLFQADSRIRCLIEGNPMLRHYLNSDRNLREMVSQVFGPARQEMERRRDLYHLRLELIPGGYKLLGRLSYFIHQAYENKVARGFQKLSRGTGDGTNPQRGMMNNQPLPNPWLLKPAVSWATMDARMRARCDRVLKAFEMGDLQLLRKSSLLAHRFLEEQEGTTDEDKDTESSPSVGPEDPKPSQPPAKKIDVLFYGREGYQSQLEQLVQLGYTDRHRNLCALRISLGNVDSAVRLLDHWNRSGE